MQMSSPVLAVLGCVLLAAILNSPAADWPQFLGPHANGVSDEKGLLDSWPEKGPPIAWTKEAGTGYSAPSIREGKLVLHHRVQNKEIVQVFNAKTGAAGWSYSYPSEFIDPYGYNNGPRSTPLLTQNRCYTFGAEGKLLCLDIHSGKLIWQRDTSKDWEIPQAFFGVGSTPVLEGNLLYVMVGGQPDAGVVALEAETGKTVWEAVGEKNWQGLPMIGWPNEPKVRWQRWEKQASYSTPVLATIHGKRHLLCLTRQGLVSLDPAKGTVNFSFWFRARVNESVNAMTPFVSGDLVFISAAYYKIGSVLLRVRPDGQSVEQVWRSTSLELHWTNPIEVNGYLYAFSGRNEPDARFRCVELQTGKLAWDRDESWPPHSTSTPPVFGRGSAILADGKLIALGEGGLLGIFKPDPAKVSETVRYQVPGLHYPCWAAPVLCDKLLYLRSEDRLVCLDLSKH